MPLSFKFQEQMAFLLAKKSTLFHRGTSTRGDTAWRLGSRTMQGWFMLTDLLYAHDSSTFGYANTSLNSGITRVSTTRVISLAAIPVNLTFILSLTTRDESTTGTPMYLQLSMLKIAELTSPMSHNNLSSGLLHTAHISAL